MIETNYRAFISYNHRDRDKAVWLQRRLESYRVPRKLVDVMTGEGSVPRRLQPIFRDEECMAAGDLSDGVKEALKRSRFLIVVCSPEAAASPWVDREIRLFKKLHGAGSDRRVLAAVVAGESGESEGDALVPDPVVPAACKLKAGADGSLTDEIYEPLAADLRFSERHANKGVLKLISGLVGVGLDDLLDREHHRKQRAARAIAGLATAGFALTGGLLWAAVDARREAETQRQEAERQRDEAENLVEFMLTDLRQKLDAVGRLDALDSVGERALQYYAAQDLDRLDPDSLGRRARAQLLVGEVDNLRGDLDAALKAYTEAAATTEEQLKRDPENAQRIFDHAQSVFWVGYVAMQRGEHAAAQGKFEEYLALAEQLVAIDPTNREWRLEVGYANTNLGSLAELAADYDSAEAFFRQSAKIKEGLLQEAPGDPILTRSLGQSYSWLARVQLQMGNWSAAEASLSRELALYEQPLADDPNNVRFLQPLWVATKALSSLQLESGELRRSAASLSRAESVIDRLVALEPENTEFAIQRARQLTQSAEINLYRGAANEAERNAKEALTIIDELRRKESSISDWRGDQLDALNLLLANVANDENWGRYGPQLSSLLDQARRDPKPDLAVKCAQSSLLLGRRLQFSAPGRASDAERRFRQGLESLDLVGGRLSPFAMMVHSSILLHLNDRRHAETIASLLSDTDYRHPEFIKLKNELARAEQSEL